MYGDSRRRFSLRGAGAVAVVLFLAACGDCPREAAPSTRDAADLRSERDAGDALSTDLCRPCCGQRRCGSDGCGGSCGTCLSGHTCDGDGQCVAIPYCEHRDCGSNGRGVSCGSCGPGAVCGPFNLCLPCARDCEGRDCGSDRCGGICGTCAEEDYCVDGRCTSSCTRECVPFEFELACGPDGCGRACGWCGSDEECSPGGACQHCHQEWVCDCAGLECGRGRTLGGPEDLNCCGPCYDDLRGCDASGRCVLFHQIPPPLDVLATYLRCSAGCLLDWTELPDSPEYWDAPTIPPYEDCLDTCLDKAYHDEGFLWGAERLDETQACVASHCRHCAADAATVSPCLRACLFSACAEILLKRLQSSGPLTCRDAVACHESCSGQDELCIAQCMDMTVREERPAFLAWLACYFESCPAEGPTSYCLPTLGCMDAVREEGGTCREVHEACVDASPTPVP